jgi:hypothetical protein
MCVNRIVHRINRTGRGTLLAFAILATGVLVSGCETSSTITQGPNPVKCGVTLAAPAALDAAGGAGSLAVTTQPECVWEAATTADWISVLAPASGQGSATVSFRVAANDGASPRDGAIIVNGEQARVSQRAPCRYDVSPSSLGTGASGGSSTLRITTSSECAWTVSRDVTWITFTSTTAGSGNGTVSFSVAENRDDERSGSIVVANQRAVVTQASGRLPAPPTAPSPTPPTPSPPTPPPPSACMYSLSRGSDSVTSSDGAASVNVSTMSTCAWTAVSNAPWISVVSGASGVGNGSVQYGYMGNTGGLRTGTLTIAGLTFTVTQAACVYSLTRYADNAGPGDGVGNIGVTTTPTCTWTAVSNVPWITVASGTRTGSGSVDYHHLANTGGPRTGTLTIAGFTVTVTQPQAP